MRIKKISPTTPANGNIENQYGTSQTNAYSENYANTNFATKGEIPTKTSDLTNDSNFITNVVNGDFAVSGQSAFPGGTRGKTINGGQGIQGFFYVCDITTTGNYQNQVIMFDVIQRGLSGTVKILLNSSSTQGNIEVYSIKKQGDIQVYYIVANNVLKIYLKKIEAYDQADICNIRKGVYMVNTTITWVNTTVSSLPSGYSTALDDGKFAVSVTANEITSLTANQATAFTFNDATNIGNTLQYWTITNGALVIKKDCTILLNGMINTTAQGYIRVELQKNNSLVYFYHCLTSNNWATPLPINWALRVNYNDTIQIKITQYNDSSTSSTILRSLSVTEI